MSKGDRYGKYPGKNDAGVHHYLLRKDAGTKRWFRGSDDQSWEFRDPKTGTVHVIHGHDYQEALSEARSSGWLAYTRRTKRAKNLI